MFAFPEGHGKLEWPFGALDGCFISPCSLMIMLMAFKGDVAMVLPMRKVFDRRYILASRDTHAHDFFLKCKVNPDA
jgi:hypothetical protein